jgi:hypothetical protein
MYMPDFDEVTAAVVRVGDGRGFVVRGSDDYDLLVVTAAHCLPSFPPCASFSILQDRTYPSLIGRIGETPSVWAQCLFVDPIGDIAVLGQPDNQSLIDESDAYDAMMEGIQPLSVSDPPIQGRAWMLSLDGRWSRCTIDRQLNGPLRISEAENIARGMSGSPVIADDGSAIAVVVSGSCDHSQDVCHEGGPYPVLTRNLPGWLLKYWDV